MCGDWGEEARAEGGGDGPGLPGGPPSARPPLLSPDLSCPLPLITPEAKQCSPLSRPDSPSPGAQKQQLLELPHDLEVEDLEDDIPRRKNRAKGKVMGHPNFSLYPRLRTQPSQVQSNPTHSLEWPVG